MLPAFPAVVAKQLEHDRRARPNRRERLDPPGQVVAAGSGVLVQPPVVGREVELAHATRYRCALFDRHQPFIVAQVRADAPGLAEHLRVHVIDLRQQLLERDLFDLRIVLERRQHLLLTLEFLQDVGLQVRARRDVGDFEQRQQRGMMIGRRILRSEVGRAREQVFKPHQCADPFVQRVFVADHLGILRRGFQLTILRAVRCGFKQLSGCSPAGVPRVRGTSHRVAPPAVQCPLWYRCCR